MDDRPVATSRSVTTNCSKLRHKGMYVVSIPDPDDARYFDPYDATAYWCAATQKALGPDGCPVLPETCRAGRSCCS